MGYEYDVFLSYKRKPPFEEWLHIYFLPLFKNILAEYLDGTPKIFLDIDEIKPGETWDKRLNQALACSRCLICIWSPKYFQSEWCVNELAIMRYREMRLKYRTKNNPSGLIIPVKVCDGETFPRAVEEIQCKDFRKFALSSPGFKNTADHSEFESQMQLWVPSVAPIIRNAPEWRNKWLKWVDNAQVRDLKSRILVASSEIAFPAPVL